MFSHCSIGLPVLRQLVIPSSLLIVFIQIVVRILLTVAIGGQEAQDLVAFIEPQVSRVENNLIICYCS